MKHDTLHGSFVSNPSGLAAIIEWGDEMITISIMCFYVLRYFMNYDPKLKILSLTKKR